MIGVCKGGGGVVRTLFLTVQGGGATTKLNTLGGGIT